MDYPALTIEVHSIATVQGMQLNEVLCDRFNVPGKQHSLTPAVFAGAGYLVRDEISFGALGNLIAQSQGIPPAEWYIVEEQELEEADKTIAERRSGISAWVVVSAAFIDSINPCAFATIIFFVSYLQVARRKRSQILQICVAFIAGVFITYFLLGFGLAEIVLELDIVQRMGKVLNFGLAVFVGVMVVLNVRDGILCLKGRHKDMALKLPVGLRDKIHGAIRKGARHRQFMAAAFVVGAVVAVLELPCTGQVYGPTILYAIKTGQARLETIGYLLLYNTVFVAPLFVILGLTWFGLRSETLTRILQKHAATVKFATAALFLIMLAAFILAGAS